MKVVLLSAAAVFGALTYASATPVASSCSTINPNCARGAPGPIAGAGLPFFAVGYGVYWLIKRRRKAD
jgi:hypothetical protein